MRIFLTTGIEITLLQLHKLKLNPYQVVSSVMFDYDELYKMATARGVVLPHDMPPTTTHEVFGLQAQREVRGWLVGNLQQAHAEMLIERDIE